MKQQTPNARLKDVKSATSEKLASLQLAAMTSVGDYICYRGTRAGRDRWSGDHFGRSNHVDSGIHF
ncbi:hypothetical protein H5410_008934 [Solanum commersonii]|uniref:Uncharacterized protein n=1 Tax=Solanum commersonii TaxID=4109 RepID=A0A9J6AHC1_SOLCO|nr:hypothetical protein H5410_008934 [Solanum commersonii]